MSRGEQQQASHVAVIMDGNGRWAKKRGLPRVMGHNAGMKAMKEILRRANDMGLAHLTVYAFSTENWKRSADEIGGIFNLLIKYVRNELDEVIEENVKINILGDYTALPQVARRSVEEAIEKTKDNDGMCFNIALNYGSRKEMTDAARNIAMRAVAGEIDPDEIDEELFASELQTTKHGIPDPDLVIRTSGEVRISNYLLWQIAYSEMVFTDILWPDLDPDTFEKLVNSFQNRERRFGGRNA